MIRNCIRVPKDRGEEVRRELLERNMLDSSAQISAEDEYLYIPLADSTQEENTKVFTDICENITFMLYEFKKQTGQLKLENLLDTVPHFEIIGDIALIEEDTPEPGVVADAIIKVKKNVRTVLAPLGPVEGEFRTRRFRTIAGEDKTSTIHKEYGCRYHIDLEKAYFTPRLATERSRILAQIKDGDTVADMFAGVGPYSIIIAKKSPLIKVIAIDKNPSAVQFLKKNIELNATYNVKAIEGDAIHEAKRLEASADHVIMNLPHNAHKFLDAAMQICARNAIIHYYDINPQNDLFDSSLKLIEEAATKAGKICQLLDKRVVRSYAPYQFNVCIEVEII